MNPIIKNQITFRLLQFAVVLAAICSFAAVAQAQTPDVSGTWRMYDEKGVYIPNDATIRQLGASVTLDNGHGSVVPTTLANNTVSAWGLVGTVLQNGNRIEWSNGYVWAKIPSSAQTQPQIFAQPPAQTTQLPDLNGKWKMYDEHGAYIPQDATISQSGTSVTINNGHGSIVPSSIVNNTVSAWNLTGNIVQSGWRIEWSNGYVWTKIRNTAAATVQETPVELPADQTDSQNASIPPRTIEVRNGGAYDLYATFSRPGDANPKHWAVQSGGKLTVSSPPGVRLDEAVELRIYMANLDDRVDIIRAYIFRPYQETTNICYEANGTTVTPGVKLCDSSVGEGVEPAHVELRNEGVFTARMTLKFTNPYLELATIGVVAGATRTLYLPTGRTGTMTTTIKGLWAAPDVLLSQDSNLSSPPTCFKVWGSVIAPKVAPCTVEGSGRLLTLRNRGGWNARMDVTYYNSNRPLIGETPVTVSTNVIELGGEETIMIPRGTSTTPVEIVIRRAGVTRDEGTIALKTTLPYDFADSHCYRTEGTVFQPTGATCEGDANPLVGNTRQIQFKNIAAFDAALEVTYIESTKVNGVKKETSKTVTTGFINAGVTRNISVPEDTAKNRLINVHVIGNATVRNDIFFGKIPANFSNEKTPCIKVWGTVFQPVGGPCTATTPVTEDRTITFYNTAGFTAKLMIMYYPPPNEQGISMPLILMSEDLPSGQGKSFLIPESGPNTKVTVKLVGISTLNDDFFTEVLDWDFTGAHCYKAWGTLFSPQGGKCD